MLPWKHLVFSTWKSVVTAGNPPPGPRLASWLWSAAACGARPRSERPSSRPSPGTPSMPLYTAEDAPTDPAESVGRPGEYPFTRGPYESMYRGRLWTMRQFAGFGTVEETNERFHYLLDHGQTGLSTAFDMPTLMGYDSDHPPQPGRGRPRGGGGRQPRRHGAALRRHPARRRHHLDDDQRAGGDPARLLRARRRAAGGPPQRGSAARSRPTSSRSTSPRRSGASRSSRRCGWSPT